MPLLHLGLMARRPAQTTEARRELEQRARSAPARGRRPGCFCSAAASPATALVKLCEAELRACEASHERQSSTICPSTLDEMRQAFDRSFAEPAMVDTARDRSISSRMRSAAMSTRMRMSEIGGLFAEVKVTPVPEPDSPSCAASPPSAAHSRRSTTWLSLLGYPRSSARWMVLTAATARWRSPSTAFDGALPRRAVGDRRQPEEAPRATSPRSPRTGERTWPIIDIHIRRAAHRDARRRDHVTQGA